MAEGYEPRKYVIQKTTVTGTTDTNGFLSSNINVKDFVILGCENLKINGATTSTPHSLRVINQGSGVNAKYNIQFRAWDDVPIATSSSVTVDLVCIRK